MHSFLSCIIVFLAFPQNSVLNYLIICPAPIRGSEPEALYEIRIDTTNTQSHTFCHLASGSELDGGSTSKRKTSGPRRRTGWLKPSHRLIPVSLLNRIFLLASLLIENTKWDSECGSPEVPWSKTWAFSRTGVESVGLRTISVRKSSLNILDLRVLDLVLFLFLTCQASLTYLPLNLLPQSWSSPVTPPPFSISLIECRIKDWPRRKLHCCCHKFVTTVTNQALFFFF